MVTMSANYTPTGYVTTPVDGGLVRCVSPGGVAQRERKLFASGVRKVILMPFSFFPFSPLDSVTNVEAYRFSSAAGGAGGWTGYKCAQEESRFCNRSPFNCGGNGLGR